MRCRSHVPDLRLRVAVALVALTGPVLAGAASAPAHAAGPAPLAGFQTGPPDRSPSREADFTFLADQPDVRYSSRLDGARWSPFSARPTVRFTRLSAGSHVVALRAESTDGHVGPVRRTRFAVNLTGRLATRDTTPTASTLLGHGFEAGRLTRGKVGTGSDQTPPQTTIVSAPSGTVSRASVSISFTSSEPGTFQCRLDHTTYIACTSPQTLTSLVGGAHRFAVRGVDTVGVVDRSPATASWTTAVARTPALLIADNQNRRILITDYDGVVLWELDNPTGETSAYSGPLGVRWMSNGHILATFGTGEVGEIDPVTKTFVWVTTGYNGSWFRSPYDAQILPDGNLAVATARNDGGRVTVYNRTTGAVVWNYPIHYPHLVEMVPAGKGTHTSKPTVLMGGFSRLTEAVYDPGHADDKRVVWRWRVAQSSIHRAILDRDGHSVVVSNHDYLWKVARPRQRVTWKRFQGNRSHGETRGVAMTRTGYVMGHRVWRGASEIRFSNSYGRTMRTWTRLSDGTRLNLVWGLRTFNYPD
ncbi:MAG: hypothetical protein ABI873_04350 [Marmoricola sp.]